MKEKVLGVLGGVGPMATVYFADLVVRMTEAETDQDHISMVILNHPTIPDRTAYILDHSKPNPVPVMVEDARRLEADGCDYIVIPCNTAHYFYDEIQRNVRVPILNILEETVRACQETVPNLKTIGVLATDGTIQSHAYQNIIERHGLTCIVPEPGDQASLMTIIYEQVKAGRPVDLFEFHRIIGEMKKRGCDAVILGCTELSIIHRDANLRRPDVVDSMECLARSSILACGKQLRRG
ncbi:MAG: aspartate/glutamate racemase family protein [Oscillospiraceae bacterium]|nr:aspartate/glutamate racemase family protein [Oscillospiraceae bacterium]